MEKKKGYKWETFLEKEFNEFLGGVSQLDQMIDKSLYNSGKCKRKSKLQDSLKNNPRKELQISVTPEMKEATFGFIYQSQDELVAARLIQMVKGLRRNKNVKIVFFTIDQLNLERGCVNEGILVCGQKQELCGTNIPAFIYNFVLHKKSSSIAKMRRLRMLNHVKVINPINRFNQNVLFDMITSVEDLAEFILPYSIATKETIHQYIQQFESFILFPKLPNCSHRAITVKKVQDLYETKFLIINGEKQIVSKEELYQEFKKIMKDQDYTIMKGITTFDWNHSPLEVRAYLQKGVTNNWGVVGLLAVKELFSKGKVVDHSCALLSDVLSELNLKNGDVLESVLSDISIKTSRLLDYYIPDRASCFFDFMIDHTGKPYLIRIGGFEQSSYLFQSKLNNLWKKYFKNTLNYLFKLTKSGV